MRARDGSVTKMPFLSRFRSRGAAGGPADSAIDERLMAGQDTWPGASPSEQALALILKAAAGPGTEPELSGQAAAVDVFVLTVTAPRAKAGTWRRKPAITRRTPVLAAAIMTVIVAGLSGTAVANVLPTPLQRLAHVMFDAPSPGRPGPARTGPPRPGGGRPTLRVPGSRPAASPVGPAKTTGPSPSPSPSPSPTGAVQPTATATSTASGNGKGKAKGKAKAKGKDKGKGKGKGKAKATATPTPSPAA
jgi:hypothetical protein